MRVEGLVEEFHGFYPERLELTQKEVQIQLNTLFQSFKAEGLMGSLQGPLQVIDQFQKIADKLNLFLFHPPVHVFGQAEPKGFVLLIQLFDFLPELLLSQFRPCLQLKRRSFT
jgi:hypothetical protein